MDILYLLIPLSAVLVLGILGVFAWALKNGQFDDLEQQGAQILDLAPEPLDDHQAGRGAVTEQSRRHETGATTENS
jgi:cbb3-type cytochrome oxidase maturation protein